MRKSGVVATIETSIFTTVGNAYRNFNYLIACPQTGEALAFDPLDHEKCVNVAKVRGWRITHDWPQQPNNSAHLI